MLQMLAGERTGTQTSFKWTIDRYTSWLATTPVPKLLLTTAAGFARPDMLDACRRWPNQREVSVRGIHYVQEDSPAEIGAALNAFLQELGAR